MKKVIFVKINKNCKKLNTVRDKLLPGSKSSMPPAIEVKDVWFRYEKDGKDVVQDLNLEVKQENFMRLSVETERGKVRPYR